MARRIFLVMFVFGVSSMGFGMDLVRGGVGKAVVYVSEEASLPEVQAARELVDYVKQISGAELDLVRERPMSGNRILVGKASDFVDVLGEYAVEGDGIVLKSVGDDCLIVSGTLPRGVLYAAYELLELLGVRFYSPTYELVPARKDVVIDKLDIRYSSPFVLRQAYSESSHTHRIWSAKVRLNGDMWAKPIPETHGGSFAMDMNQSLASMYLKGKTYFEAHPEWYAWRKKEGQRVAKQICMTNEEALAQLVKEVREKLRQEPNRRFLSVALPDNDACCECDSCTALKAEQGGAISALSIHVANKVANAVAEEFPKVRIMILAYWPTERPPKDLKLAENAGVVFAMLDRNHGIPPEATARHNPFLKRWSELSNNQVYIWDYYATFGNFLLPMPNLFTMGDAMRTYREHGVHGVYAQLPFGTLAEFEELRTYLLAKLTWNPDLDNSKLIDEWLAGMCGEGAPFVRQYIDLLETAKKRQDVWIGVYGERTDKWLTANDILEGRELFARALAATASDQATNRRVTRLSATVELVTLLRYGEVAKAAKAKDVQLPSYDDILANLTNLGKEFKCSTYKEWAPFSKLIERLHAEKSARVEQE